MGKRKSRKQKRRVQIKTPAPAASSSASPPWIELPEDVTANILRRLGTEGMLRSAQKVCSTWWKVCKDPAMWRVIKLFNPDICSRTVKRKYAAMCRRAVDRSQGQLVNLRIHCFGDTKLFKYVTDRSRNLKRLKLVYCDDMSADPFIQAVEKLGQLEELHLTLIRWIYPEHIEAIGNSCPKLKSFSYNCNLGLNCYDDYAKAIGKCMPNLHHLRLIALNMRNEGLEAILDGCPRLESLDIQLCSSLDLGGNLGKRCREQIKDLRLTREGKGVFSL